MDSHTLKEIKNELHELRRLYQTLVDKLVPIDEATEDEVEAIEESDELGDEEELMKALE